MNEKIYIKNMVCPRCIQAVESIFKELHFQVEQVVLGEATLPTTLSQADQLALKSSLEKKGFELLEDKKTKLIEKVKNHVIELIHQNASSNFKLSSYLTQHIPYDYSYISNIFSAEEGITIEKFVILQKIERAKELLSYNELTLSEIAYNMHYSSTAALSAQFKDITGMTPSQYKKQNDSGRKNIDRITS